MIRIEQDPLAVKTTAAASPTIVEFAGEACGRTEDGDNNIPYRRGKKSKLKKKKKKKKKRKAKDSL